MSVQDFGVNHFQRCGCSSVDRVLASEAKGRGFDPRQPHQSLKPSIHAGSHGMWVHGVGAEINGLLEQFKGPFCDTIFAINVCGFKVPRQDAYMDGAPMDGKLLLVTNAPDFTPAEVIKRYKSLADIERGFRVLKSEIEIGPIYHRLPERIRAHAAICFMALILYRVMRSRLRASATPISPERALDKLRRIQHHQVLGNNTQPVTGLSAVNQEHSDILSALTIKKPTLNTQLTLL